MHIVLVDIHIKPETMDAFIEATKDNARNSRQEPGILQFDFVQDKDDPTHFALIEVYRTPGDVDKHRETAHYLRWRDTATDMMSQPRVGTKFQNIDRTDDEWS